MGRLIKTFSFCILYTIITCIVLLLIHTNQKNTKTEALAEVEESVVTFNTAEDIFGFYGQNMTEEEKLLYQDIYTKAVHFEEKGIEIKNDETFYRAFYAVVFDYPELFQLNTWSLPSKNDDSMKEVIIHYGVTEGAYEQMMKEILAVTVEIVRATTDMTDYEKELFVHDYLLTTVDYDIDSKNVDNIYGALVNRRASCRGYSAAFQYLLEACGLEAGQIIGDIMESGAVMGHSWNIVMLEGEPYYVDVLWDRMSTDTTGEYHYAFFNTTLEYMDKTHDRTRQLKYLSDTGENSGKYSFYKANGLYAKNYAEAYDIINEKLPMAVKYDKNQFSIQIESDEDFAVFSDKVQSIVQRLIYTKELQIKKCNVVKIKNGNTIIIKDMILQKGLKVEE